MWLIKSVLSALLLFFWTAHAQPTLDTDQQKIVDIIAKFYDREDNKVNTHPVVVENNFAVADWTQASAGGRALLRKNSNQWTITLCAGDGLKDIDFLIQAGVPRDHALILIKKLEKAEQDIPAERVKQFSLFSGAVQPSSSSSHANHFVTNKH
jgi:hypothetical protein